MWNWSVLISHDRKALPQDTELIRHVELSPQIARDLGAVVYDFLSWTGLAVVFCKSETYRSEKVNQWDSGLIGE